MSSVINVLTAGVITTALATPAAAQGVIMERNVSMALARDIANAAMECTKDGVGVSVAVVDRAGEVRALLRGDGSPPHGPELARRKAYTSRTFRRPSLEWAKRSETGLIGQRNLSQVIPLGGGMPIKVGDEVIGAVGVSGAGDQQDDENCAKSALAKVADRLK